MANGFDWPNLGKVIEMLRDWPEAKPIKNNPFRFVSQIYCIIAVFLSTFLEIELFFEQDSDLICNGKNIVRPNIKMY